MDRCGHCIGLCKGHQPIHGIHIQIVCIVHDHVFGMLLFQGILFIKHHLNTDYTAVGCLSHRRCDNPQVCTHLSESHMTFNKFEMLISFQSTNMTREDLSAVVELPILNSNMVEMSPTNSRNSVRSRTLRSNPKLVILEVKN